MIPQVSRLNWRVATTTAVVANLLVPEPREGLVHRVNWWSYGTLAEAGNVLASGQMALLEGPLPEGQNPSLLDQNALRDEIGLHVLVQGSGSSSTTTNADATGRPMVPHFTFPRGLWTVEDLFVAFATDGGTSNVYSSIGYEAVKVSRKEWLDLRRHSVNTSHNGALFV